MTPLKATLSFSKIRGLAATTPEANTALVVGMSEGDEKPTPVKAVKAVHEAQEAFAVLSTTESFKAKSGSHICLLQHSKGLAKLPAYNHLVGLGIGKSSDCTPQNILHWGGVIARAVKANKLKHIDLWVDSLFNPAGSASGKDAPKDWAGRSAPSGVPTLPDFVEKLALGVILGLYSFDKYKSKKKDKEKTDEMLPTVRLLSTTLDGRKGEQILERVRVLSEAAYFTRDLQTTPGCDMQPAQIAHMAQEAGRRGGFKVEVWDEKKLKTEGMGGILAVGQGSKAPPRFIIMEHNAGKKNLPTVVFVGKGISFDTGGISIKPSAGMEEMKYDMSGSAAVIGAMLALSKMKAAVHAVGLVASAENMPGSEATRPGDIYTAYDGQTVEVNNTDAEGRLVLADALSYAKKFEPNAVIDIATLTGAVTIALGIHATGVMGNNVALLEGYRRASDKAGERTWELPLYKEYEDDMKSKCADYRNSGVREAGSSKGGTFLNFFVGGSYPWIHLDVAATADTPRGQGDHCPPDVGTAVPMRGLVEFAENLGDYFRVKKS